MKNIVILILVILFQSQSFSQSYIGLNKKRARKDLEKSISHNSPLHIEIKESDTTLTYQIRDTSVQNLDMMFFFNSKGRCFKESTILTCDSCYKKFVAFTLAKGEYRWTKIDNATYYSRPSYKIVLHTEQSRFRFETYRSELSDTEFRSAIKAAKLKPL